MRSLPAITSGDSLGDYTIGPELGRGGIAVVHEATHKTVRGQPRSPSRSPIEPARSETSASCASSSERESSPCPVSRASTTWA